MAGIETRQLFNFIQGSDITGESSYDVWKRLGNEGTEADFLEFLRSGPKGEDAYTYALAASDLVIKKGADKSLVPTNITFSGYYRIGSEATRYDYAGRFIIQESTDGTEYETKYTSEDDEVSVVYTPSSTDVKNIKCTLYAAGDTSVEIDTQSVVIVEDIAGIEVGARNLLSNSDIRYTFTKDSSEAIDIVSIVNNFDLQRLVNRTVTLSYYADTVGSYTNADDGTNETSGRFDMIGKLVWSDSTGTNTEKVTETPLELNGIGVEKRRINTVYEITPPVGYDTIESFTFDIVLTMKPDSDDGTWVFERPKLELGNVPTQWTLAPEDVKEIDEKICQPDWEQNDETENDYIKNRTHYEKAIITTIFDDEIELSAITEYGIYSFTPKLSLIVGNTYKIYIDNVLCYNEIYSGKISFEASSYGDAMFDGNTIEIYHFAGTIHLKIEEISQEVKQLDEKFIPDTILRTEEFNVHTEQVLYYEIEETLEIPDVTLTVTDDGEGNVVVETTGMTITDDGEGNISITSDNLSVTDDGEGNITVSV